MMMGGGLATADNITLGCRTTLIDVNWDCHAMLS